MPERRVPPTGCNDSIDTENSIGEALVGRLTRGNNTGVSMAISNVYGHNSIAEEVEAGTIGSTYFGSGLNSTEEGVSLYALLMVCGTQNYSTFYGDYIVGPTGCMGGDVNGNPAIGVKMGGNATSQLFMASIYGNPPPGIGPGGTMVGNSNSYGPSYYVVNANTVAAPGATTILADNIRGIPCEVYRYMILLILALYLPIRLL